MSRGLSQTQRRIVGIAAHVNRLTQGGALTIKTGAPVPGRSVPAVDYGGVKDLQWPLAAHLLGGLPFVAPRAQIEKTNGVWQPAGHFFDLRPPAAKSVKASLLRAIASLVRTGHLLYALEEAPFRWGYVLSEAGLALGQQYEYPFAPPLIFRAGLIVYPDQPPYGPSFHALYARLVSGALTLEGVLTTMGTLTPRPLPAWQGATSADELAAVLAWHTVRQAEEHRVLQALLGPPA